MSADKPRAYVDLVRLEQGTQTAEAVHLVVQYDGREALLELPVEAAQPDQEPGIESYRKALARLLEAIQEVQESPEGIYWPPR